MINYENGIAYIHAEPFTPNVIISADGIEFQVALKKTMEECARKVGLAMGVSIVRIRETFEDVAQSFLHSARMARELGELLNAANHDSRYQRARRTRAKTMSKKTNPRKRKACYHV